ncbi:MAG: AHH domain-containing protein [Fuerstiella sp.]
MRGTRWIRFWSEDRQDFVQAGELATGEHVRLLDGSTSSLTRAVPLEEEFPVFNLEVDGEHVYYVGLDGVLVHNAGRRYDVLDEPGMSSRPIHSLKPRVNKHHIASNKSARFTRQFQSLFRRAGMNLKTDPHNLIKVAGHVGPHGRSYNEYILDRLRRATATASGNGYNSGFGKQLREELMQIRWELRNTDLGDLLKAAASRND